MDGRHTLGGCGDLDHQVGTVDTLLEVERIGDAALGAVRRFGRHLQADEAVRAPGAIVDGSQDVGGPLDVGDGQAHEDVLGVVDARGEQLADLVVVLAALRDRLLEDGGIAGHPGDVVLGDQALELAAGQQVAADVVEPDRLALVAELLHRVRRGHSVHLTGKGARRRNDGVGVDPGGGHQLGGGARPGQFATARWTTRRGCHRRARASRTALAMPPSG